MQAVVLAGGLGRRMLPRTEIVPKYLLPVAGRPFAAWQLGLLRASGFEDVVLCVGHLGGAIRDALGDGGALGVRLRYVDEGEEQLGTGGALSLACRLGALRECFLVTYGDSYLPFDYASPLRHLEGRHDIDGAMAVFRNQGALDASNCEVDERRAVVTRYQKGAQGLDWIDYGALALRRALFERERPRRWGLEQLQEDLCARGRMGATVTRERFHEIGSERGLSELSAWLQAQTSPGG